MPLPNGPSRSTAVTTIPSDQQQVKHSTTTMPPQNLPTGTSKPPSLPPPPLPPTAVAPPQRKSALRRQSSYATTAAANNVMTSNDIGEGQDGRKSSLSISSKRVSFGGEDINYFNKDFSSPEIEPPPKSAKHTSFLSPNPPISSSSSGSFAGSRRPASPVPKPSKNRPYIFAPLHSYNDEGDEDDVSDEDNEFENEKRQFSKSPEDNSNAHSPLLMEPEPKDPNDLRVAFSIFCDEDVMSSQDDGLEDGDDDTTNLTALNLSSGRKRNSSVSSVAIDEDITINIPQLSSLHSEDEKYENENGTQNCIIPPSSSKQQQSGSSGIVSGRREIVLDSSTSEMSLPRHHPSSIMKSMGQERLRLSTDSNEADDEHEDTTNNNFEKTKDNTEDNELQLTLPLNGSNVKLTEQEDIIGDATAMNSGGSHRLSLASNFSPNPNFNLLNMIVEDEANDVQKEVRETSADDLKRKLLFDSNDEDLTLHGDSHDLSIVGTAAFKPPLPPKPSGGHNRVSLAPMSGLAGTGSRISLAPMSGTAGIGSSRVSLPDMTNVVATNDDDNNSMRSRVSLAPLSAADGGNFNNVSNILRNMIREDSEDVTINYNQGDDIGLERRDVDNDDILPEVDGDNVEENECDDIIAPSVDAPVPLEVGENEDGVTNNNINTSTYKNHRMQQQPQQQQLSRQQGNHDGSRNTESNIRSAVETIQSSPASSLVHFTASEDRASVRKTSVPQPHSHQPTPDRPQQQFQTQFQHPTLPPLPQTTSTHSQTTSTFSNTQTLSDNSINCRKYIHRLKAMGIHFDVPSPPPRDQSLLLQTKSPSSSTTSNLPSLSNMITSGARNQAILSVLHNVIRNLHNELDESRRKVKENEAQLQENQSAVFNQVCSQDNNGSSENGKQELYLHLKRSRKVCTIQAKSQWVESRQKWESSIARNLRNISMNLKDDIRNYDEEIVKLKGLCDRDIGFELEKMDGNQVKMGRDELVRQFSSLKDIQKYIETQEEEENELEANINNIKEEEKELVKNIEYLEYFKNCDGTIENALIEQRELNSITMGISGIWILRIDGTKRLEVLIAGILNLKFDLHSKNVINVVCGIVPNDIYIDKVVEMSTKYSKIREITKMNQITSSLFSASQYLLRIKFAIEEAMKYQQQNTFKNDSYKVSVMSSLNNDITDDITNGIGIQVGLTAVMHCSKRKSKFDIEIIHQVYPKDITHFESDIVQQVKVVNIKRYVGKGPTDDEIKSIIEKTGHNGRIPSIDSALNHIWSHLQCGGEKFGRRKVVCNC